MEHPYLKQEVPQYPEPYNQANNQANHQNNPVRTNEANPAKSKKNNGSKDENSMQTLKIEQPVIIEDNIRRNEDSR